MKNHAVATLMGVAICLSTGTAGADPAVDNTVSYIATGTDNGVVITTDAGSMHTHNGVFTIRNRSGATMAGTELSFRVDDFVFPIAAQIQGNQALLTPQLDLAHATYRPAALPFDNQAPWKTPYEREQAAWNRLTSTILMGANLGTIVGGLGGAAVGCVLGGIAGATVAAAAIVGLFGGFLPAAAIGCIGGVLAIGALGTVAGQLLVTAPIAIMAAVQYFTTINEPFQSPAVK
ncbi:hypothetical protein [Nocardia abscessus]|uniref:hypothetical protein n=1 Tax=Nocardia abscessus TaxID=120957 RepID=UPI002455FF4C|nr:hypothetical protein [Nocardia abscessus]